MNAVFERDYVRNSVSGRWQVLRAGFACTIALVVGFRLLGAHFSGNFSDVGSSVLAICVWAGLTLFALAMPGSFGSALVSARTGNTLPVLFASPLTPLQVSAGAFLARAGSYAVFVMACWPPVAIALSYGGVRPGQMLLATAALLGALLLLAAPAFIISAFARSTGPAVVGSYVAVGTILTALTALGAAVESVAPLLAVSVSPVAALRCALDPRASATPAAEGVWLLFGLGVFCAAAAILIASARLHSESRGGSDAAIAACANRGYLPLRHENPVLDREIRTGGALRSRSAGRTLVGVLAAAEIAYGVAAWKAGAGSSIPLFGGVLFFHTFLLVIVSAAAGATSLAAEKESGAIDVLRVTPLQPREIVGGKLLGLFRALLPALSIPCIHLAWGAVAGIVHVLAIPAYLASGAIVAGTWTILGMQQSLDVRTPARAVVRTMGAFGLAGVAVAGYAGVVLSAALGDVEAWIRGPLAFGANAAAAALIWVAGLRVGGSDSETTLLAAPTTAERLGALTGGGLWLGLHVLVAVLVLRSLSRVYRTRFEG